MINKKDTFTIVGLGEILWDLLPDGKQLGGAPANFAFHAQSLGAKSFIVSAVGDDSLGHELFDLLLKLDLNRQYIFLDKGHPTGTVSVELDEEGNPNFTIHENVAWDYISKSPDVISLAKQADAICFGSLAQRSSVSRSTILSFIRIARQECIRVYDVNLRQSFYSQNVIQDTLELSDVLKLNNDELSIIADMCSVGGNETEILKNLIVKYKLKLIALTKGKDGSRLITSDSDSTRKADAIRVVDSVGAGDAFTAAMIIGILKKMPLDTIHEHATLLASYVCTQKGATPNLTNEIKEKILNS